MSLFKILRDLDHGITPKKRAQMDAEEAARKRQIEENTRRMEEQKRQNERDRAMIFRSPVSKLILDEVIGFLSVTDPSDLSRYAGHSENNMTPAQALLSMNLYVCVRFDCVLIGEGAFWSKNNVEYRFVFKERGYVDLSSAMQSALCDYLHQHLSARFSQIYDFTDVAFDRDYRTHYLGPSSTNPHWRFEISKKPPVIKETPLSSW